MSSSSTLVTREHFDYVAQRTAGDDEFLLELKAAAQRAGIPAIWISPEQASFMQILLRLARATEVVEVGTLAGYSALVMARALGPEGRVRTIELEPRHADFAEEWVAQSDVPERIAVHRGPGSDVLATFESDSADALFLDADKSGYSAYIQEGLRIVRPGGLIMADNAFAFGQLFDEAPTDREVGAVREFNDFMASVEGIQSVIVPMGDGLWVGVKR